MGLQDLFKRSSSNKKAAKKPEGLLNEIGASGTNMVNGFVNEEYNADLAGLKGIETYDKMRASDATVFATLLAMELPIRATKWSIQPGETLQENGDKIITDEDYKIANFIEDALFNRMWHTFDDFIRQALTMLPFGFSVFEKVYKVEDGAIYWSKFAQRLQKSIYSWETIDGKPGITQQLITGITKEGTSAPSIPLEKLLVFTFRKEGTNPEGRSVLRSSYKNWYIKDQLYKYEAVKFERQAVGIPVMTLPDAADDADKAEAETILENIRSTEQSYVLLPSDKWKFEFADLKASNTADPEKAIAHHNREIAKNILAHFIELGATGGGSYALSEDQSSLFLLSLTGIANQLAEILNRHAIEELVDLNFDLKPNQTYPKLTFNKLGDVDYTKLASSLATLTGGGIIQADEDLEDYVRSVMDLPKKLEDQEEDAENELEDGEDIENEVDDETPEEDVELEDLEDQLAELEASEIVNAIDSLNFTEEEKAAVFKQVSSETAKKISEALKEYWRRKGKKTDDELKDQKQTSQTKLDEAKQKIGETKEAYKAKVWPIQDEIKRLQALKTSWGSKKELTKAIKELRTQIKGLKTERDAVVQPLQTIRKEALTSRVEANKELRERKKQITAFLKDLKDKVKSEILTKTEAQRQVRDQVRENATQIKDLREGLKSKINGLRDKLEGLSRKDPQYKKIQDEIKKSREATKTLIDGVRSENETLRSEIKEIWQAKTEKREDLKQKVADVREGAGFSLLDQAAEFSESTAIKPTLVNKILKKIYEINANIWPEDLGVIINNLKYKVKAKIDVIDMINKASDDEIDQVINDLIDFRTGDIYPSKSVESFNEDDLKKLGFENEDDLKEFKEAKKVFNILDILNVQKYDK